jgi:hypothetical protein
VGVICYSVRVGEAGIPGAACVGAVVVRARRAGLFPDLGGRVAGAALPAWRPLSHADRLAQGGAELWAERELSTCSGRLLCRGRGPGPYLPRERRDVLGGCGLDDAVAEVEDERAADESAQDAACSAWSAWPPVTRS